MSTHPFHSFIDLVTLDQRIWQIEQDVAGKQQVLDAFDEKMAQERVRVDGAKERVHALRKDVDEHELMMKDMDEKLQHNKKRLDDISNYKEYESVKKEIETLGVQQHEEEEELLQLWNTFETAEKKLVEQERSCAQAIEQIAAQKQELQTSLVTLQNERATAAKERPEKEQGVPEEWLEKYRAMRARTTNPVVPVDQGSCSGCSYLLSVSDMQRLHKGALLQCKGCYRFLYITEAMGQHDEQ